MTAEKKDEKTAKEQEARKEMERVQKIMVGFGKRIKGVMDPLADEIRKDIKKGDVNIANNKVQTSILPLLFMLPPANALGILDLLNMQVRGSIAKTRKPVEVKKKHSSTAMFG